MVNPIDDRSTHTVADQRGLLHPGILHDGYDGARKIVHAVTGVAPTALAVAGQVNQHQSRLARQRRHLLAPETEIAGPAMDEYQGVVSSTDRDIVDLAGAEGDEMGLKMP
jgi:hypothetical protein